MASSKYKRFTRRKLTSELRIVTKCLKRENAYLKELLERFLSLQTVEPESCQQLTDEDEITLPSEQLSKKEVKLMDEDSSPDEWASINSVQRLQSRLSDALEKNKRWLDYDQQREAYVRAILARLLCLEKQLNEANQARSQQHNGNHSDETEQISQMQEHYEGLLQKANDQLEVSRELVDLTYNSLMLTQNWCKESEREVEELKQKMSRKSATDDHHCSGDEEQWLWDEIKDLQRRLDKEELRSADFELQVRFLLKRHLDDQERIADLEQQRDWQDHSSCEVAHPPSPPSSDTLQMPSSPILPPHGSSLKESSLEHPSCQAEYPENR